MSEPEHSLFAKFRAWLDAFDTERFDRKIARDAQIGRLDWLAHEALSEFGARKPTA